MKEFIVISQNNKIKLSVVLLPTAFQVMADFENNIPQKKFKLLMNKLNIPNLDLLPYLRKKYVVDRQNIYYDHCHMKLDGNIFVGHVIGKFLLNNFKAA